jgi:hypothetical protein
MQRPCLNQKELDTVAHTYHPSYVKKLNRRLMIQAGLGTKLDPISKITKAKGWWPWLKR